MKKKALATKMAAFVMAGAMTMAMGFPAFATTTDTPQIPFTKNVADVNSSSIESVAENVYKPNTEFRFKLEPATDGGTIKDGNNIDMPVSGGFVKDGVMVGISHTQVLTMTASAGEKTVSGTIDINYNAFYANGATPGIYHYILTEENPETANITGYDKYDGMTYSQEQYDLYVFLNDEDHKSTNSVLVTKGGDRIYGKDKTGTISFTNTYTTYNLDVKKLVTGNQPNMSQKFTFTINVNGGDNEQYKYIVYDVNTTNGTETVAKDTNNEDITGVINSKAANGTQVELRANQVVRVYGLSEHDKYKVEEDSSCKDDGYKTSITVNGTSEGSGDYVYVVSERENSARDNKIVYTNDKTVSTPTGIVTEYAPYILLVAAAGAFAVLFLRRRKEEF